MDSVSAGEAGGIFAGAVALLYAFGRGFGWLFDRVAKRIDNRAAEVDAERERLAAYRAALDQAAKEYREGIEERLDELARRDGQREAELAALRHQNEALAVGLFDVTDALRGHAPESPALARVAALLRAAFPPERSLPAGMAALLARFEMKGTDSGDTA
jgi:hypothetical protein